MLEQQADDRDHAFGRFRLSAQGQQLLRDGTPVPLGARALDLLLHLVLSGGALITKDALLHAVWPGRVVEENNLTVQMSALRRVLAEADLSAAVQTIPGRGYRFTAPVERLPPARATPPPVVSLSGPLPQVATRFIGRAPDLAALRALLSRHRLVTVSGIGGIGKTRVALRLAEEIAPQHPDGVWLIDLSVLTDPAALPEAVAAGLGLGGGGEAPMQRLLTFLRPRHLLLILDNCEHMVGAVGALAQALMGACPRVTLLATSREGLGIAGEQLYRLPTMSVPAAPGGLSAESALAHDSVQLLVDRAAESLAGFALTDANAGAIAEICTRLDGIALAIEMVAPRLRVLSPQQLADRLHERFRLLVGPKGAATRQRTLRAMLDWSWELLSAEEQRLLRRLSVFAGGARLEALQAVAAEPGQDEWALLDLLSALVDKSLVVAETTGAAPRYRLLETTRHYARERQAEAGEAPLERRHAAHFAAVYAAAQAAWPMAQTTAWLEAHGGDADNLRAALDWAFGPEGDTALGLALAAASTPLWWDLPTLPLREGRLWFSLALARIGPETPEDVAAGIWFGHSWPDVRFGDRENFPAAARAVALYRASGNRLGLGAALWRAGSALLTQETAAEASLLFAEAEQVLRAVPPSKWLALTLVKQADLLFRADRTEAALAAYEEALRLSHATGHWYGLMNGGSNMAELLFHRGEAAAALSQLEALRGALSPGRRPPLVATLAAHLLLAGRPAAALEAVREVAAYAPAVGMAAALAWAGETLALLCAEAGDLPLAARLAGHAIAAHPSVATRAGARRAVHLRLHAALDSGLDAASRARLLAEGAGWGAAEVAEAARLLNLV